MTNDEVRMTNARRRIRHLKFGVRQYSFISGSNYCSVVIRHSSFVIRHSSFVIRHSSFGHLVIRHSSFVIRHSSFVIRHSSFVSYISACKNARYKVQHIRRALVVVTEVANQTLFDHIDFDLGVFIDHV